MINYGCISSNILIGINNNINNRIIDNRIDQIVNTLKCPIINYNDEIIKVINTMNKYSFEKRVEISEKYDDVIPNFLEVNNSIDINTVYLLKDICNKLVAKLKIKFNLPRPFQISYKYGKCIYPISLKTTHSPTLPSGHTSLYYLLYLYFSKIDIKNKDKYKNIYLKGAESRIIGGNHFYIDNYYSIIIIDEIKDLLNL